MCVPCVAIATPGIGEILLIILGVIVIALSVYVRWLAVTALMTARFAYRFFSGARVVKPLGESDDAYWARTGKRPKYARHVKAVGRTVLLAWFVTTGAWGVWPTVAVASASLITMGGHSVLTGTNRGRKLTGNVRVMLTP